MESMVMKRRAMRENIVQMRQKRRAQILKLHEQGYSNPKIASLFNIPESAVRSLLKD